MNQKQTTKQVPCEETQTAQATRDLRERVQEIQSRREEARHSPDMAAGTIHLALYGLSSFVELFDERMTNIDVDRLNRATLALGLNVQSIGTALTTLVGELQRCVEDLDMAMERREA